MTRAVTAVKNTSAVMDSSDTQRKNIAIIGGGLVRIYLDILFLVVVLYYHYSFLLFYQRLIAFINTFSISFTAVLLT